MNFEAPQQLFTFTNNCRSPATFVLHVASWNGTSEGQICPSEATVGYPEISLGMLPAKMELLRGGIHTVEALFRHPEASPWPVSAEMELPDLAPGSSILNCNGLGEARGGLNGALEGWICLLEALFQPAMGWGKPTEGWTERQRAGFVLQKLHFGLQPVRWDQNCSGLSWLFCSNF